MNLPTQHQVAVVGTHLATAAAAAIAALGFAHVISPADVTNAGQAVSEISDGIGKIMAGVGTLIGIGSGIYAFVTSGPLASLFRASKAIAADPTLTAQMQKASIEQKATLVTVTDKLPEVAGVGTTRTAAGEALAAAVPSATVQSTSSPIAKAV